MNIYTLFLFLLKYYNRNVKVANYCISSFSLFTDLTTFPTITKQSEQQPTEETTATATATATATGTGTVYGGSNLQFQFTLHQTLGL